MQLYPRAHLSEEARPRDYNGSELKGEQMTQTQYIVGVDEVGRGPLAGPVAVCAALVPRAFDFNVFPLLTDSKKLSEKRREEIFDVALALQTRGLLRFAIQYQSPQAIDDIGIESAISRALKGTLADLRLAEKSVRVFLDGRLKAPDHFEQETVVRGDEKVPIISLASVVAKVARDRLMTDLCSDHPAYGFSKHKGYGTKGHIAAIKENGPSPLHRKTFLTRIAPEE